MASSLLSTRAVVTKVHRAAKKHQLYSPSLFFILKSILSCSPGHLLPLQMRQNSYRLLGYGFWKWDNLSRVPLLVNYSGMHRHLFTWLMFLMSHETSSQFGAEVIKVEPPRTGDPLRVWRELDVDGTSPWFRSIGRNKKSVAIDLRKPEGRE
jgi:hypothetical protein